MRLIVLPKLGIVILLTVAFCGGWTTTHGVSAQAGSPPEATGSPAATTGDEEYILQTVIDGNRNPFGPHKTPTIFKLYQPLWIRTAPSDWLNVTPGAALQVPRGWHTATRLSDDKILLVGGTQAPVDFLAEVEIFDPAAGLTRSVAPLHTSRHQHTATLLPDGRVLVVGGYGLPGQWRDDAEVYDPDTDTWTVVPPPSLHGVSHTATRMKNSRVLVVGGAIGDGLLSERAEIFDPQADTWTEATPLASVRASHTAQLLEDGRVLVAGGFGYSDSRPTDGDALLYDPKANTWTATEPMVKLRVFSASARLADGRVLVAGGQPWTATGPEIPTTSAEIYDPVSNKWTAVAELSQPRILYALVPLQDGQVLAIGGARDPYCCWTSDSFVREIERYDPTANEWRVVGELPQPTGAATASFLQDGRVWVAGGQTDVTFSSDTWLIDLPAPTPELPFRDREKP